MLPTSQEYLESRSKKYTSFLNQFMMDEGSTKKRKRNSGNAGRCSKARSKKTYSKKRKYQYYPKKSSAAKSKEESVESESNNASSVASTETKKTASDLKLVDIQTETPASSVSPVVPVTGYQLLDVSILADVFHSLCCPGCKDVNCLELEDINEGKKGLARLLQIHCKTCLYKKAFYTSKQVGKVDKDKGGQRFYDVNIRSVYAFRQVGIGHKHLRKICCYLNMPSPMLSNNYTKISNKLKESAKAVAEKSMAAAAASLRGEAITADVGVSVDGSWQRKGYTSMNGVVTAISIDNGKVLDTVVLCKNRKGCTNMQAKKSTEPQVYENWYAKHKSICKLNHKGSSPVMETVGAETIFTRSVDKHNLYYTSFYGDGDSKAYPAVSDIYGSAKPVTKYECIGHYQKRIGTRLRKKKKEVKGLGGRGRLTDAKIDVLQNYFGIALRQNCGNLDQMILACKASMFHVAGYHDACPQGQESWCQYQLDRVNNTSLYKDKKVLPLDVRQAILPIYLDLCKRENLEKCLHGRTQNNNESFNGMIWNRVPKATHVGIDILSLGVYDAIAHFNDGAIAAYNILKGVGVEPGSNMVNGLQIQNKVRKRLSAFRMSGPQLKKRKIIRHLRKKKYDKNIADEGTSYEAGGF